ncbi:hypothetical protein KP509_13G019500 [Ceratopteris richardii]|uniref:Uncharacterized protein n=1 Tax=Ceratopteris richardii TaxID=49495 RepID=A0A8T2TDT0_CERRI|nr:hypothetical protein KP509_13G019500 [Ceratopteris richardii]
MRLWMYGPESSNSDISEGRYGTFQLSNRGRSLFGIWFFKNSVRHVVLSKISVFFLGECMFWCFELCSMKSAICMGNCAYYSESDQNHLG